MVKLQQCNRSVAIIAKNDDNFKIIDFNQRFKELFKVNKNDSLSNLSIFEALSAHIISVFRNRTDFKFPFAAFGKRFYGFISLLDDNRVILALLEYDNIEIILNEANISFFTYDANGYVDSKNYYPNIHKDDYLNVLKQFSLYLQNRIPKFEVEFRVVVDNTIRHIKAIGEALARDFDGIAIKIIGIYIDITKYKERELFLERLAYRDALTDTYNRLGLVNHINEFLSIEEDAKFALIFFDLDNFKKVNDIYGHKWGDRALVKLCCSIKESLPIYCHLARISGDEFILFIEHFIDNNDLENITKKVLLAILHSNDKTTNDDAILTASAGIAIYPKDASTLDELIVNADMAMYISKKRGKAQYTFFSEEIKEMYFDATLMHRRLLDAFKNDEFSVHYQAVFDTDKKEIAYYEVIPFWNNPKKGKLIADDFVYTLYEEGLIVNFDEWLIDRCLRDIVKLRKRNIDFKVSMNMSPKHLSYDYFTNYVESKLKQYGVKGSSIKIEMVEFILKEDFQALNRNFRLLHELDCEIIIDGFGINSSTIGVLTEMHFDTIKINKFFVETIDKEYSSKIIFDTIYKIAKEHNKQFVAEGVCNKQQYEILIDKSCKFVQGNYLSEPKPLKDIFDLEE